MDSTNIKSNEELGLELVLELEKLGQEKLGQEKLGQEKLGQEKLEPENLINSYKKKILVISGGGLKGLSGLGSLKCLIDNNISTIFDTLAGSSVGAVICFLYNIGYGPQDMYEILEQLDFTKFIKYIEPENLLLDPCFGISSPEPIMYSIYKFMKNKNINKSITFSQLYTMTKTNLIITGTCLNDITIKYFSHSTTPDMQILKALRITISIPFIFRPYQYDGKLWVDGGLINNFPIDLFNEKLNDVIGIYMDDIYDNIEEIEEIQDYFIRVLKCVFRGLNYNKIELFKKYFVHIKTQGNHTTNWEISQQEKKMLYDEGYKQTTLYIEKYLKK
jgi:NTE family protein